jgi:FkbM family methyltransferase
VSLAKEWRKEPRVDLEPATSAVKRFIKRALRRLGVDVRRYRPESESSSQYVRRRSLLMAEHGVSLVLDVGAGQGMYGLGLRRAGYAGRIVSFEPLLPSYLRLKQRAETDSDWMVRQLSLGAQEGEGVLNIASNLDSSSLLPMAERHLEAAPHSAYSGQEMVRIRALDHIASEFVRPDDRVLFKMDVQGYEREVLRGATHALGRVALVECELSLCTLYSGQPLLPEMAGYMQELGFQMVALVDEFSEPEGTRVLQVNALFERVAPLTPLSLPGMSAVAE